MKISLKINYFIFLIISTLSFSQTKKEIIFIGYRPLLMFEDKNGKSTNTDNENPKKKWFNMYELKIKNDSVFLDKTAIIRVGKEVLTSESDGGKYYFKGIVFEENGQNKIELTQIDCDYCPRRIPKHKGEIITKNKLYGKITKTGIVIDNIKFNEIEYSNISLISETQKERK